MERDMQNERSKIVDLQSSKMNNILDIQTNKDRKLNNEVRKKYASKMSTTITIWLWFFSYGQQTAQVTRFTCHRNSANQICVRFSQFQGIVLGYKNSLFFQRYHFKVTRPSKIAQVVSELHAQSKFGRESKKLVKSCSPI